MSELREVRVHVRQNMRAFSCTAETPDLAIAQAEQQARAYIGERQWTLPDGKSAYKIDMKFHEGGHGITCVILVTGPEEVVE